MPDTRIALVTGATAGLGRAVAAALAGLPDQRKDRMTS